MCMSRGLNLDSQCEPIQTEIEMLEACADEVQAAVTKHKAESKRLKKELAKLKENESSLTADVDELTQALHDDVVTLLLTLFLLLRKYLDVDS